MRNERILTAFGNDEVMMNAMNSLESLMCVHVDIITDIACTLAIGDDDYYFISMTLYYAISRIPIGSIIMMRKEKELELVVTYIENKISEIENDVYDVTLAYRLINSLKKELNNHDILH